MKFLRFRLSSVLICFTVVAVVLGYTQARRQKLMHGLWKLTGRGCRMGFEDHWLWPVAPESADIVFRQHPSGDYSMEKPGAHAWQPLMSKAERLELFKSLQSELLDLGVDRISLLTVRRGSAGDITNAVALESLGL